MRPTQDLAHRARNWFWYWRVRQISGLTNEQLDHKCFGAHGRRRHFERLEDSASDPDDMPLVDGKTLLALVDAWDRPEDGGPGPYAGATRDFGSKLWSFLASRDLAPSVYTDFIQQYAAERGWIRAHDRDYGLYAMFLGADEPAIEHGVETAYSAMLHRLVNEATPDTTAVLVALFREAMHQVELEYAIAIRKALTVSIMWMGEALGIPQNITQLIRRLVSDRVLSNRWITEADWRAQTNTPVTPKLATRARIREFNAWVRWYTKRPLAFDGNGYGRFPLVPRSARTDWLEAHRDFLDEVRGEVGAMRHAHWNFRDSLVPENRALAEQARIHADGLLSHICPPDAAPERFYTTRPNLEMGGLPPAFPRPQRGASSIEKGRLDGDQVAASAAQFGPVHRKELGGDFGVE